MLIYLIMIRLFDKNTDNLLSFKW